MSSAQESLAVALAERAVDDAVAHEIEQLGDALAAAGNELHAAGRQPEEHEEDRDDQEPDQGCG